MEENIAPLSFSPLPGYRAMLKLGDNWVTAHFREFMNFANTAPAMVEYILDRLDITRETFNRINWTAIAKVRRNHKINRIVRTSKMMYGWLPVGHNWQKCKLPSDKCLCCRMPDESFAHLLQCKHESLTTACKSSVHTSPSRTDATRFSSHLILPLF